MSASVKDVALAAGVSLGTVSNVLNRPDLVRPRTRQRVERAMAELNFVRNESARLLRSGRSSTLAYVVLDVSNPFFTDVARGVEDVATTADLLLYTCNSGDDVAREHTYLSRLEEQRVAGILVTPIDPQDPMLVQVSRRGTPVVLVDRARPDEQLCSVTVNDVLGGRLAAEHVIDRGHQRIAYVGGSRLTGQVHDRRLGAADAVREAGLADDALVDIDIDAMTVAAGRLAGARIAGLPRRRRPTAAFCANDQLALGLLQQCVELGIDVPGDLAIVGYDDVELAGAAAVPLTSVRQPRHQLGVRAAELLLDEASDPGHRHQNIEFLPEIVARRSTVG